MQPYTSFHSGTALTIKAKTQLLSTQYTNGATPKVRGKNAVDPGDSSRHHFPSIRDRCSQMKRKFANGRSVPLVVLFGHVKKGNGKVRSPRLLYVRMFVTVSSHLRLPVCFRLQLLITVNRKIDGDGDGDRELVFGRKAPKFDVHCHRHSFVRESLMRLFFCLLFVLRSTSYFVIIIKGLGR